jgi:hypothetical protein
MKLRMLKYVGGTHDGLQWPAPGDTVEIDNENLIDELLRSKVAETVTEEKPTPAAPIIETAEKAPAENTAKRVAKPKPRAKGAK